MLDLFEEELASLGPAGAVLVAYPHPVFELDLAGQVAAANPPGRALLPLVHVHPEAAATFAELAAATRDAARPMTAELPLGAGEQARVFELVALPTTAPVILVLCHELSFERNMRRALVESRQRFQDLVAIASDFAWETLADGNFGYVSPAGALGRAALELVGADPRVLLADADAAPTALPFATRTPVRDAPLWLLDRAGTPRCMLISAQPLQDAEGHWCGARGVCRDITAQVERDQQLSAALMREQLVGYIVDQIRNEAEPTAMLQAAVSALAAAASADAVVVGVHDGEIRETLADSRENPSPDVMPLLVGLMATAEEPAEASIGSWRLLANVTQYLGNANGILALVRDASIPWSADDRSMLVATARQLGIALRQVADQAELQRLSRTDELTGLLNRRAFWAELDRAALRVSREGRSGALLFVDLDHFKSVNDTLGHDAGDRLLRDVAAILAQSARPYDLVARLGGDEFVLWLDGAGRPQAEQRAAALTASVAELARTHESSGPPFGASIGISVSAPGSSEGAGAMMGRADADMYRIKARRRPQERLV